jgi:hypothetical protein
MLLRWLGVGPEGRLRVIMVIGMVIGALGIAAGLRHGRASMLVVGLLLLVGSPIFWSWVIRRGRERGTV